MKINLPQDWRNALSHELEADYFKSLQSAVDSAYLNRTVYPPPECVFNAFGKTPFDKVKVVILGQDPYHGPNQAHGLAFSVLPPTKLPPSLKNIFKELELEFNISLKSKDGDLSAWAKQGVLLLNATLTVEASKPTSHHGMGWERFTDAAISKLSEMRDNLVFLLWGNHAREKSGLIDASRHLILKAAHPSPLSAYHGFFNCGHFKAANEYLAAHGIEPIDWLRTRN